MKPSHIIRPRTTVPAPGARIVLCALSALALAAAIRPAAAGGQAAGTAPTAIAAAACTPPVLLPPGHWVAGAIQRLEMAGPYEMASAGTASLPLISAHRALAAAAESGESTAVRQAASAYLTRLTTDYPPPPPSPAVILAPPAVVLPPRCAATASARVELGYAASRGLQRPGFGYDPDADWTGAFPLRPVSSPAGAVELTSAWGRVGARVEAVVDAGGLEVDDAHVAAQLNDVIVWAGRRAFSYGPAGGGGIIFGGTAPVTAVGAMLIDPIRLPWILGLLGPIGAETFFGRARGGQDPGPDPTEEIIDPWLWGARLTGAPHPRFRLGVSRGTMFGGEGNTPVTLRYALQMLGGMHSGEAGEFDNHFGTVDVRFRPPGLPLDLYLEWGMHDSAGAWWAMPARLVGAQWSALPFAPGVGVGAEFVHFPRACCGNPIWYRNWAFRMGWTDGGRLLGHPLGGHGSEASVRADAVLGGGTTVFHARAFRRDRGDGNLFWPQWGTTSVGAEASLLVRSSGSAGASLRGFIEAGDGWRAGQLFAGLTWSIGG